MDEGLGLMEPRATAMGPRLTRPWLTRLPWIVLGAMGPCLTQACPMRPWGIRPRFDGVAGNKGGSMAIMADWDGYAVRDVVLMVEQ